MRRVTVAAVLAAALVLGLATSAGAASVHLKGGRNAAPDFTDQGLTLNAAGELAGLGNGDVLVTLDAQANVDATCTNPSGKNEPPGQNPAPISVTGSEAIPADEIKNGNTPFNVTTEPPVTPIAGAPDCPNPNWTEDIVDLSFTSATITVEQPAGTTVLVVNCTFSSPTANGSVPRGNVSCTQIQS
ncbi:MAG TPA: hypothetical protein VFZ79_10260 [Acidimicrobiales bacterium]